MNLLNFIELSKPNLPFSFLSCKFLMVFLRNSSCRVARRLRLDNCGSFLTVAFDCDTWRLSSADLMVLRSYDEPSFDPRTR